MSGMEWINVADGLPEYGKTVMIYHTGISGTYADDCESDLSLKAKAQEWSNDNPHRFARRYKTAFNGDKWMVSFGYSGVGYIADDVNEYALLTSPPVK